MYDIIYNIINYTFIHMNICIYFCIVKFNLLFNVHIFFCRITSTVLYSVVVCIQLVLFSFVIKMYNVLNNNNNYYYILFCSIVCTYKGQKVTYENVHLNIINI